MGRGKEFRQRLKYTVSSARQKTLEHRLHVQLVTELGMSEVEASLMSLRLSQWILARPDALAPNQMVFSVQAGRDSFGRGVPTATKSITLTPFDIEDLDLEEEFGLPSLQLGRMLRLIEEAERQDALLSARQLTILVNIAPSSLRRRLAEVRGLGMRAPVRGLSRSDREKGGLHRSTWVLEGYLEGRAVQDLRQQVAMSRSRFSGIVNRFADLAEWVKRGEATGVDAEAAEWLELLKRCSPEQLSALAAGRPTGSPPERSDWGVFSSHLAVDFALSPAKLRAVTNLVDEILSSLNTDRDPGQVIHWAVAADEPPGKPLSACRLVPVGLTYWDPSDEPDPVSNRDSNRVQDLKVARIQRFCQEAKEAGGYLTYADLSYLLGIHTAALGRMVRDHAPEPVPLRGSECDIGRGITHRSRVIELYLQMHTETEIVSRTGHSYESIESYIKDFAKVLVLSERGLTPTMIRRVTGRSMALVRAYLDLVEQYSTPDHAFRFHQLRKVFYRQEEATAAKKNSRSNDP